MDGCYSSLISIPDSTIGMVKLFNTFWARIKTYGAGTIRNPTSRKGLHSLVLPILFLIANFVGGEISKTGLEISYLCYESMLTTFTNTLLHFLYIVSFLPTTFSHVVKASFFSEYHYVVLP